ncbi:Bifunctional inhibitor/plant lipid transfer protein/seed storage helical domain [Macleaya cordata]|uniref:Bifunctional inhibitor/plant lipid transfer protein/seed storage helical domain n=1 Tax=Macleaya cordata TaxID=56857 RepID=A0A200Q7P2_MACCD|nr:Bifunctional inhibitor/plant lipid transfer protein/seed storage helical domain [Macleaya cordata]
MKMVKSNSYSYLVMFVAIALILIISEAPVSMAATCKATELASCYSAITSSSPPSALCCRKLKEQRGCLCKYLRDPNLKKFVNSANARRVGKTCGVPFPIC